MGRPCKQVEEGGAALGLGGKLAHVGGDTKQGHGDGPVPKQALKPLGGRKARIVGVEGEEDAAAATQRRRHPLHALGAQGGDGGQAPLDKCKPVDQPLGDNYPRRPTASRPSQAPAWDRAAPGTSALHWG